MGGQTFPKTFTLTIYFCLSKLYSFYLFYPPVFILPGLAVLPILLSTMIGCQHQDWYYFVPELNIKMPPNGSYSSYVLSQAMSIDLLVKQLFMGFSQVKRGDCSVL